MIRSNGFSSDRVCAMVMKNNFVVEKYGTLVGCINFVINEGKTPEIDVQSFVTRLIGVRDQGLKISRIPGELPASYRNEIVKTLEALFGLEVIGSDKRAELELILLK